MCSVSLWIWTAKQGNLDWTSLMGNEKKKLLTSLPSKFFLPPEVCEQLTKLWKLSTIILFWVDLLLNFVWISTCYLLFLLSYLFIYLFFEISCICLLCTGFQRTLWHIWKLESVWERWPGSPKLGNNMAVNIFRQTTFSVSCNYTFSLKYLLLCG